jgi:hypothetical protein
MRLAVPILMTSALLGCSGGSPAPPAPTTVPPSVSPQQPDVYVAVVVVQDSGQCIVGATVQSIAGQAVGQSQTQKAACDVWSGDGDVFFLHLQPGVEMTLRASAPGYRSQEKVVSPTAGPQPAVEFILTPSSSR